MCDLSMKQTRCYRARSSGLRFLAAGLLPLLRLRVLLCQGRSTLIQIKHELYLSQYLFWGKDHAAYSRSEKVTLVAALRLSQKLEEIDCSGTDNPTARHCPYGMLA